MKTRVFQRYEDYQKYMRQFLLEEEIELEQEKRILKIEDLL